MKKPPTEKKKKKRIGLRILLLCLILVAAAGFVGVFLCKTETLHVEGNTILEEAELKSLLLAPEHTDNSLYFWFYYKYRYGKEIPFADSVEVHFQGLKEVTARIREEESIGYMKAGEDLRAYFDRSGNVTEISEVELPDVPLVTGIDHLEFQQDQPLPIEDLYILKSILTSCREIVRLQIPIRYLEIDHKGAITFYTDTIEVSLGQGEHLEEKIALAQVLLEKLEGRTGILHLEDYDGTSGTRSFQETVPTQEEPSEDADTQDEEESGSNSDQEDYYDDSSYDADDGYYDYDEEYYEYEDESYEY